MARCEKCGREFEKRTPCQRYCYETCIPVVVEPALFDSAKVHEDCVMYHDDGRKMYCSGLLDVYCGYGGCRFYKRGKKNE